MRKYLLRAGTRSVASSVFYIRALRLVEPGRLFALTRARAAKPIRVRDAIGYLKQLRRMTRFFLLRILRHPQPCLVLGCVLYEAALRLGLDACLAVGAATGGGQLFGHCWLELNGAAFMEPANIEAKYPVMLRG